MISFKVVLYRSYKLFDIGMKMTQLVAKGEGLESFSNPNHLFSKYLMVFFLFGCKANFISLSCLGNIFEETAGARRWTGSKGSEWGNIGFTAGNQFHFSLGYQSNHYIQQHKSKQQMLVLYLGKPIGNYPSPIQKKRTKYTQFILI